MIHASRLFRSVTVLLIFAGLQPGTGLAARADEPTTKLTGSWKLVVLAFGEDEFAIIDVNEKDGKPTATVAVCQRSILGDASIDDLSIRGDSLEIHLRGAAGPNTFVGTLAREGAQAGRFLGTFSIRGEVYPARLERTDNHRLAGLKPSTISSDFFTAAQQRDPRVKAQKLREGAKKYEGDPTSYLFYGELLATAEAGGLDASEVDAAIKANLEGAKPYGQAWVGEVRRRALKAISSAKPYANITLELAEQADKELDEEHNLGQKAAVVAILAKAADLAGKADLARRGSAFRQAGEPPRRGIPQARTAVRTGEVHRAQGSQERPRRVVGAVYRGAMPPVRGRGCRLRRLAANLPADRIDRPSVPLAHPGA